MSPNLVGDMRTMSSRWGNSTSVISGISARCIYISREGSADPARAAIVGYAKFESGVLVARGILRGLLIAREVDFEKVAPSSWERKHA
jgi:hypothetical protein